MGREQRRVRFQVTVSDDGVRGRGGGGEVGDFRGREKETKWWSDFRGREKEKWWSDFMGKNERDRQREVRQRESRVT